MRQPSRTVAAQNNGSSSSQDFVAWSAVAMWSAAAVYLLATFQPF